MISKTSRHEKAPIAPTIEAHETERKSTRKNVMMNNSTAVSDVIPFRSSKLLLVEHDGEPFVAMKPVVEGMGLAWQAQHAKLTSGRFNSAITMIVTTGLDGKQYEMACLPLKKLPGWLMSIHASKVRTDLRANVLAYQNECDDALWAYWNEGHATNNRASGHGMTLIGQTIGTDGFHMLGAVVKGKVCNLPQSAQRRATAKIWSQTHAAFGVRSAADIPAEQLDSARNFIAAYTVREGEFLGKESAKVTRQLNVNFPLSFLTDRRPDMLKPRAHGSAWLDVTLDDIRENRMSPCEMILSELERAGYEISAAWWEIRTLKNKTEQLKSMIRGLSNTMEDPHRYAVKAG